MKPKLIPIIIETSAYVTETKDSYNFTIKEDFEVKIFSKYNDGSLVELPISKCSVPNSASK